MTVFTVLAVLLSIAAAPVVLASLYLGALALLARPRRPAGVLAAPAWPTVRFDVLVPAHDEALDIERTVRGLRSLEYPAHLYRVLVIADNCSDRTAEIARGAGAHVLERHDRARRGKGYALTWGFEASRRDAFADAVVVVDADTTVPAGMLGAFAARLDAGEQALQADYGVRNPGDSWRTRLMTIALALFHGVRSEGRERCGLSCGLRGNGMCFTHALLARVPHRAHSIVEDLEYGIDLGMAGVRAGYVGDVTVLGAMPATGRDAASQRERWEGGRFAVSRRYALPLLRAAVTRRSLLLADLAVDLLVPPLTYVVLAAAAGLALSALLVARDLAPAGVALPWLIAAVALLGYLARGCQRSGLGLRAAAALAAAPLYIIWKLVLRRPRMGRRVDQWVRTPRTVASQEN